MNYLGTHAARRVLFAAALLAPLCGRTLAQDQGWRHSASFWILTTPDGADLPATCLERGFPLLVRLNRESLGFSQAQPDGADIRFTDAQGASLAYQIEEWDPAHAVAAIWVRIPEIRGNSRQEIKMHWGNSAARRHSNGAAVFDASNSYLSVLHLGDTANPVRDEARTLTPADAGTTACAGVIGQARHFDVGKGIRCGQHIMGFPAGDSPHTSEAWIRAERPNAVVLGWGNEHGQGKVTMLVASPPHVRTDCYFSNGNVEGKGRLPMSQWVHVVHTYQNGDARVYVNGRLDGQTTSHGSPLAIRSPACMWIGGWYDHFQFVGDIDEVRISKAVRSADWIKLEYENQKAQQTLLGGPVQPGRALEISPAEATVDEGKCATFTAKAGGAEKVYWILKRGGKDTVVAVDRFSYTLDAGRVVADTSCTLQFKAVYPGEVKTKNIPVTIKDVIPEPAFTLQAPSKWNGRETIAIVPAIGNLEAMKAAGAGELHYRWSVAGGAVIKRVAPDRLVLKRSQYTGPITVTAVIDNGGEATVASGRIDVTEPKTNPWIERTPEKDEKPEDGQFYARDDKNEGTLHCNGTLDTDADSVCLRVYADGKLVKTETQPDTRAQAAAGNCYAFAVKLKPGLIKYRAELRATTAGQEKILHTADDLVCGDAYLIDGQSNALATDTREQSLRETSPWIRSYGGPTGRGDATGWVRDRMNEAKLAGLPRPNLWCNPVWKAEGPKPKAELGYWGMELAKRLVASQQVPICIINAAVGGTRIDEHQPSPGNHADLNTMYGHMLWRVQQARLAHGIRAVIWHQGESDQGSDGPTGGYGWETYQPFFIDMSAAWKEDMPNIRHYYTFQIWPNACSMGGREGSGDRLREAQRTLPRLYSNMDIMSTLGIRPPGPCHYPLTGWAEFARLLQPLIERDFYGKLPSAPITPPNLRRARYTSEKQDEIALEFDQPVVWKAPLVHAFYLDGDRDKVAGGVGSCKADAMGMLAARQGNGISNAGNVLVLRLREPSAARTITYLKEISWNQEDLLFGGNDIAALTFCDVPILPDPSP